MPTKIKSRKGKTMMKARRSKLRLKRGVDAEEGVSGRRHDMKEVQAQAARLVPISGQGEERRPKPTLG